MGNLSVTYNKNVSRVPGQTCVSPENVSGVRSFHEGLESYAPTPLVSLRSLAGELGVERFLVKDESKRFGLNAFKALGGSYAIAKYICGELGLEPGIDTFAELRSGRFDEILRTMTFVTATDGNHGRGVAWTAKELGCRAVVFLPKGSAAERVSNILAEGAQAEVTEWNYDDTVRHAAETARRNGWILVQDTAWPGYEEIPCAIMQGYTTLAAEIDAQLRDMDSPRPTHLFLQAGVGSMAGAIAGYLSSLWGEESPRIVVVEPDRADCLFQTAKADDGSIHTVTGSMDSMMAGLCCGEPCTIGWDILKSAACAFISCDDSYAACGMRLLGRPAPGDQPIVSGESGAVTSGVAAELMRDPGLENVKKALGLGTDSRILVISTEGDTDRENYRRILRRDRV